MKINWGWGLTFYIAVWAVLTTLVAARILFMLAACSWPSTEILIFYFAILGISAGFLWKNISVRTSSN